MNKPEEIKRLLTPKLVACHYLGQGKQKGGRIWYKSPFRNERTASFMVDDKAFHDFGDGWHGDVIDFVGRYYSTDFINAMKILSRDFGLPESEYISKELEQYLKQKREEEIQMQKNLESWFYDTFEKIRKEILLIQSAIPKIRDGELLAILYKELSNLEYLLEVFEGTEKDEIINLWRDKEEFENV